ncbi:MAG: UMP kinase [Candidatus Thermoplasmatota archaeon]|nr:UMP kinase [Candidatus Thermoplasmatota archaeon]
MPKDRIVVSLGGSVLVPGEDDSEYIRNLARLLIRLSDMYALFVVTGGGRPARYYIEVGRDLGMDERALDAMGIILTRLNARLLIQALGPKASPEPPEDYEEAREVGEEYDIVVMGGQRVSITTDGVAAELAEAVEATRLINATSVDGVYTADPNIEPTASRFDKLSYEDLIRIAGRPTGLAGPSIVIDPHAAQVIKRARISVYVVQGRDLKSVEGAIIGGDFVGTVIGEDGSR